MAFLGIDNAEKSSGAVLLDHDGIVLGEWACGSRHHVLVKAWHCQIRRCLSIGDQIWVEDLFLKVAWTPSYKPACRAQGIIQCVYSPPDLERVSINFIQPNVWQNRMGYKRDGRSTKRWAKDLCEELNYTPPPWSRGSKALEDLRDAFLIAQYARLLAQGAVT